MAVLTSFARVYVCDIDEGITIFQHSPRAAAPSLLALLGP
jgi:hypothetical protein